MRRILEDASTPSRREVVDRDDARARFEGEGEPFKVELIDDLPPGEAITLYTQDDFVDLCRGPHLQTTAPIKAFKLTSLAGAYWRGDAKREQLTRVYGTAFFTQAELDEHLHRLEEARRRDHRRIGRELDLFSFHEESPGSPFWHPDGLVVWNSLVDHWRAENRRRGYREVKTPILYDADLWKTSGHWDKFGDSMYTLEIEERDFGLKPMNCPAHCLIYKTDRRSYRDLPLRMNEVGLCHRNEPRARCTGSCASARSRRTTRTSSARRSRSRRRCSARSTSLISLYELFGMESGSSCRPGPRSASATTRCGTARRRARGRARPARAGVRRERGRRRLLRAEDRRAPDRRASAAPGSAARSSSTSTCPSASTSPTPARTTASTGR